ncbi:aldehyde dehydrogenase family protein [Haladaptatus halobius]|uniref:aldehyde dehydrogenase family protein n=1 Tax=Haladaptatus halobius TaxID=2884875 RepID=UPI001D09EEEF|nr:aldehyde dehydrogenase family protein [Haladaptatus halobius]
MSTDYDSSDERYELFIGGKPTPSESGEQIPVTDPSTSKPFETVAAGSSADIDRALKSAREAFSDWRGIKPVDRGRVLQRMANRMHAEKKELAELLTRENGKPISQSKTGIEVGARYFEYYAGTADKVQGETIPLGSEYLDYTLREPLGVTGHIVPWNFPVSLFARTVAPALATGNAVVVKPAEQTPLTAVELGRLLHDAGVPAGAVNVVPGYGIEAGAALSEHEGVDGVAFTGSVPTGREVAAAAARTLTPVHIEAGGKNPIVVYPDADLERAIDQTMISIFTRNAGQVCSAGDGLLLHEDIHDEFCERLVSRVGKLTVGAGLEDPDVGALVSETQYEKVTGYIDVGIEEVGEPLCGGTASDRSSSDGYFVKPTIFDGVERDMRIAQEEIFGPILSVLTFGDEQEALEIANETDYGLVAGIFTRNLNRAHRFARDVVAGQVFINEWFAGGVETSFGGYRQSGFGREKGMEALRTFTTTKNVCANIDSMSSVDRR